MSMLSGSNLDPNSGVRTPSFHELRKQASFFLREKIKTARLALTDVTPAELLAEEAVTGNSPGSLDSPTLHSISRAAFEVGDYWRIVGVLHRRLSRFDAGNWRVYYNSLIVLEHLFTHGPESIADEFQIDKDVIAQCGDFQHIDEKGFNWGLAVRKKSDRILKLLEKGPILREERERSRKLRRSIQGFGSFCGRTTAMYGSSVSSAVAYGKCNSQLNSRSRGNNELERQEDSDSVEDGYKEKTVPRKEAAESKRLLVGKVDECRDVVEWDDDDHDHPFNDNEISHYSLLGEGK